MESVLNWVSDNWGALLGSLSLGGGGSILGKKLTDKKQNERIKEVEDRVSALETGLKVNEAQDEEFRTAVNNKLDKLDKKIDSSNEATRKEIGDGHKWIVSEIMKNMRDE